MSALRADPQTRWTPGAWRARRPGSWIALAAALAASATLHAAVLIALAGRDEATAAVVLTVELAAPSSLPQAPPGALPPPGLAPPPWQAAWQDADAAGPAPSWLPSPASPSGFLADASASTGVRAPGPSVKPPTVAPPTVSPPTIQIPGVQAPVAAPIFAPPAPAVLAPAAPPAIRLPAVPPPAAAPHPAGSAAPPSPMPPVDASPPGPPRQPAPARPPAAERRPSGRAPAAEVPASASSDASHIQDGVPAMLASLSAGLSAGDDAQAQPRAGNPPPHYPVAARRALREGRAVLRVVVSRDGEGREVRVAESSGTPILDAAALDAVQAWRFEPARRGGVLVEDVILVPVVFRLMP